MAHSVVLLSRLLVLSLAAVAVAQPVLNGVLLSSVDSVEATVWSGFTSTVVVVLVSVPLALLLVLKKADDEQARLAAVLSVLLPVFFSSAFLAGFVLDDLPSAQPLSEAIEFWSATLALGGAVCLATVFFRFTSVFPVSLRAVAAPNEPIHGWLTRPRYLWILLSISLAFFPLVWWGDPGPGRGPNYFTAFFFLPLGLFVVSLGGGVSNLRLSRRLGDAVDRRRGRWISLGLGVGVGSFIAAYFMMWAWGLGLASGMMPEWLVAPALLLATGLFFAAPVIMALALAVGVLYNGAIGPDLVISRGALHSGAFFAAVFLYSAVEELLTTQVTDRLGLPGGIAAVSAAGVAAICFAVVERRAGRWLRNRGESAADEA